MTEPRQQTTLERWLSVAGSIAAPVTVVSVVLFYFGYVSARAQYDYFGLDVDTVGLSTQAYVMRSPQPLLVPLLVLIVLGAVLTAGHRALRRRVERDGVERDGIDREGAPLRVVRVGVWVGIGLVALSLVLLFGYFKLKSWSLFPLVVPLLLALGAAVTAYCLQTLNAVREPVPTASAGAGEPAGTVPAGTTPVPPGGRTARPGTSYVVLLWLTVGASVFWATATIAQWTGRGLAKAQARDLTTLPSVVLDTREPLALPSGTTVRSRTLVPEGSTTGSAPGTTTPGPATSVPASPQFRYQYFRLRLLIQGDDRLFLVPDVWSNRNTTLVVPLDGTVRVQFQFRNDPP